MTRQKKHRVFVVAASPVPAFGSVRRRLVLTLDFHGPFKSPDPPSLIRLNDVDVDGEGTNDYDKWFDG